MRPDMHQWQQTCVGVRGGPPHWEGGWRGSRQVEDCVRSSEFTDGQGLAMAQEAQCIYAAYVRLAVVQEH